MSKKTEFFKVPDIVNKQDGQILLVVILATVVALTVGLSAITRTVTNTRLSTEEANSQKALSAAEAGIEQLLSDPDVSLNPETPLSNDATFTAGSIEVLGSDFHLNDGGVILKDDGADIWLTSSPDFTAPGWPGPPGSTGTLTVYWTGEASCPDVAAIEIIVLEGNRLDPTMTRYTADSCGRGNFDSVAASSYSLPSDPDKNYQFSKSFDITSNAGGDGGYIVRLIPLYQDTEMGVSVDAGPDLPVQGHVIESVGTSGDTKRKLRVFRANPRLPIEFFPYNVFLPEESL